ncbi:COG1361 S-layer family protein [Methanolobus sp. ZRKC2]|uniref:COG1361 S-layer family protein n=1 Tax=Methanolobus sp. ZRKC2 TaxID=3125783 RepID=UPI00324F6051
MLNSSNPGKMWEYIICFVFVFISLSMPAAAAEGADLEATILRYEPTPAEIGEYVTVWVKIENLGFAKAEDVKVRMVPEYPFSLDSPENAVKDIGILKPDDSAVEEYRLFVDEDAKEGIETIEVWYQEDTEDTWYKQEFEIRVGSTTFDSKGNVQLQGDPVFEPEVFMPGDRGTVSFTLANIATTNTVIVDEEEFDTNARVQAASLEGPEGIEVTTNTYQGEGIIGPGESMNLTYSIVVDDDVVDGTYYLELFVIGSSHEFDNNWRIPFTVDSSSVRVIPSSPLIINNGMGTIEFDVANIHPNMLSSVSVSLEAEGFDFSPDDYFIGAMDPDELFTIEFIVNATDENTDYSAEMLVNAEYRNGLNDHSGLVDVHEIENTVVRDNSWLGIAIGVIVVIALAVGGYMMYRRRKENE